MSELALALVVGATVLFGSATQRLTGMGFALVSGPLLVLMLGALSGVPLIQVLSFFVAASTLASTYGDVEWRKALSLMLPALLGIIPGWFVMRLVPGPILLVIIGLLVVLAIVAMLADKRARVFTGTRGLIGAGFLSGFMNYTAGVGGPAIVLYSLSNEWDHKSFVGTVQVYFMGLNVMSLIGHGIPSIAPMVWLIAGIALIAGILVGNVLARRVPVAIASRLVIVVALAGALATIAQGATQLLN